MNNLLFDLRYSLRKWKQSKILFILIVISFALLIQFLSISTSLVSKLSENQPLWVGKHGNFVTLGRTSEDGQLMYTSLNDINEFSILPNVKSATSLILESTELGDDNNTLILKSSNKKILAAFVPENFNKILRFDNGIRSFNINEGLISNKLWIKLGKPVNLVGSIMYLTAKRIPITIVGITSQNVNFVGLKQPDIWVRQELYKDTIEIDMDHMGLTTEEKNAFMNDVRNNVMFDAPIAYGILSVDNNVNASQLFNNYTSKFGLQTSSNKNFNSSGDGLLPALFDGIDFNPELTKSIKKQWVLYFSFVSIFAFVCFINLFSHSFNQYIYRSNEWSIRRVIGGNKKKIAYQLLIESLPLICSITTMALLLNFVFYHILVNEYWKVFLGKYALSPNLWILFAVYSIVIISIISCYLFPVISLKNNIAFNNIGVGVGTKTTKRVIKISFFTQLSAALFFLAGIMSAVFFINSKIQSINIDTNILEFKYESSAPINITNSQLKSLDALEDSGVAYSPYSIAAPNAIRWQVSTYDEGSGISKSIPLLPVSDNYFKILGVNFHKKYNFDESSVVINKSAAKLLFGKIDDVVGNSISIKNYSKEKFRVAAVIDNIPHYGISDINSPVIYSLLSNLRDQSVMYFFGHDSEISLIKQSIDNVIGYGILIKHGGVAKNILNLDVRMRIFYIIFVFFGSIIVISVFVTFAYQFSHSLFNESKNIAIFKMLGISSIDISNIYARKNVLMILLSTAVSLSLLALLNNLSLGVSGVKIYNLYVFVFSIFVLFSCTTLIALPTLRRIVNTSIFKWLRS
jgi:ABC-type antimicrobial peptide transport system permease subunit